MPFWGTVTIGGMALREERVVDQSGDAVSIAGQESYPPRPLAHVEATHHNINGLAGATVPITFTEKSGMDGFYRVTDAKSVFRRLQNDVAVFADWSLSLERVGGARDVEVESRVPTIARLDEITGTQTPVFWHAPAVGFTSYWTGATEPTGTVSRESADGAVTVRTGIPANVAPRWTAPVGSYLLGSSRILLDGLRRVGTDTPAHSSWRMHNGIVQVAGEPGGRFSVAAWDANDWRSVKGYATAVGGVSLTTTPDVSILRNDPEECALRLSYPETTGRVTTDLSLRRGSRFVAGVVKRHAAATLGVRRSAAEAVTAVTGGLLATSADADGNRFVMGSSRLLGTTDLTTAYISKGTVTAFDFFLGHEFGATPAAGDAFADLLSQYLGSSGERARIVRR